MKIRNVLRAQIITMYPDGLYHVLARALIYSGKMAKLKADMKKITPYKEPKIFVYTFLDDFK